jgi:hypothetical protein
MKMKSVSVGLGFVVALGASTGISAQASTALLVQNAVSSSARFNTTPTLSKKFKYPFIRTVRPQVHVSSVRALIPGTDPSCSSSSDHPQCSRSELDKQPSSEIEPSNEIPEVSTDFRFPVLKCAQLISSVRDNRLTLNGNTWKAEIFYYKYEGVPQSESTLSKEISQCKLLRQAFGKRVDYEAVPVMVLPSSFFHQKVPFSAGTLTYIRAKPQFIEEGIFPSIPFDEPVFSLYQIFEIENGQRRVLADMVLFDDSQENLNLDRRNIRDIIDSPCDERYINEDETLYKGIDPLSVEFIKAHKAQECRVYLNHLKTLEVWSSH